MEPKSEFHLKTGCKEDNICTMAIAALQSATLQDGNTHRIYFTDLDQIGQIHEIK